MSNLDGFLQKLRAELEIEPPDVRIYASDEFGPRALYSISCPFCKKRNLIEMGLEEFNRWQAGAYVQDVFPHMASSVRETLVSGACARCFDDEMGEG